MLVRTLLLILRLGVRAWSRVRVLCTPWVAGELSVLNEERDSRVVPGARLKW